MLTWIKALMRSDTYVNLIKNYSRVWKVTDNSKKFSPAAGCWAGSPVGGPAGARLWRAPCRLAKRGAHGESSNRPLSLAMNPEQKSRPNNTPTNSPFRTKYLLLADLAHTTPQPVTTRSQSRYNLRTLHPPPIRNQIFPGIDFSST